MSLNLHLLRLFTAVVEAGSFSRAAANLYVSQPAVSKAVVELERQVGVALLDRSRRRITLTAAGATLYRYAEQIFVTERSAEIELARLQGVAEGKLAIGASTTIGVYLLPAWLADFRERYPAIRLFLDIGTTHDITLRLLQTPLDIAFVEGPVGDDRIQLTSWMTDRLLVIASSKHPLARVSQVEGAGPIDRARLLDEPFIAREPGSATRVFIDEELRKRGVLLPVSIEAGSNEAIKQLVTWGLGLALLSEATIQAEVTAGSLVVLDVPDLVIERRFTLLQVTGRPLSPSAQAFLALLFR
ncbi:MAG: LysR substrate-binding domain-containing protein [Ktedonobacterales bacterium]